MIMKQWQSVFHVIQNANSIVQHAVQIENERFQCEYKNCCKYKENYSWNLCVFVRIASI